MSSPTTDHRHLGDGPFGHTPVFPRTVRPVPNARSPASTARRRRPRIPSSEIIMKFKLSHLTRPLAVLDVETTGVDPAADRSSRSRS
ncbi:hypothetical protein FRUB_08250 [Fimbriiglobus ruber]|uniref:Uncharacterized protein n=1 Tax=Fimbriiglobus ruber TaxID=1908690 RepID=A0A225DHX7_9BACT|nr:hypothetical protein FRUB_08250 [Fimbriiglobus ruber]